jgi:hypothetical protein
MYAFNGMFILLFIANPEGDQDPAQPQAREYYRHQGGLALGLKKTV